MHNIHELINYVALCLSKKTDGQVCFSNLDLNTASSQLKLCERTIKQSIFSLVGADTTGIYRFLIGSYGLLRCCIDDILVFSKGTVGEHKAIVQKKILETLDKNSMAMKRGKCVFFSGDRRVWI